MTNKFLLTTGGIFILVAILSQPSGNSISNAQSINIVQTVDTSIIKSSIIDSFELKKKLLDEKLNEAENTLLELNRQQKIIKDNQNKISSLIKEEEKEEIKNNLLKEDSKDTNVNISNVDTIKSKESWVKKILKSIKIK